MKNVVVSFLVFATLGSANAKTFVCVSKLYPDSGQTYIAGTLNSETEISNVSYGVRKATDGRANKVYIRASSAAADPNYRPIKFKGYNKFDLGSFDDGDGGTRISILLKKNMLETPANVMTEGYLVGKSGSGGGSSSVACFVK